MFRNIESATDPGHLIIKKSPSQMEEAPQCTQKLCWTCTALLIILNGYLKIQATAIILKHARSCQCFHLKGNPSLGNKQKRFLCSPPVSVLTKNKKTFHRID